MNAFAFYLGAALLVGISILLMWETSPFAPVGATEYEKLKIRRLIGTLLLLTAVISCIVGLVTQASLANP